MFIDAVRSSIHPKGHTCSQGTSNEIVWSKAAIPSELSINMYFRRKESFSVLSSP